MTSLPGIPVLAILRGVLPSNVLTISEQLIAQNVRRIEVPLNSPDAFRSISLLLEAFGGAEVLIGAGTVLSEEDVIRLAELGCELVVSPNFDPLVVRATKKAGMLSCPGVFTPSEAFAALSAGADILKYFPAELNGPAAVQAWRAVLPEGALILATGGASSENLASWLEAGANLIGVGSALFKPGDDASVTASKARQLAAAYSAWAQNNG